MVFPNSDQLCFHKIIVGFSHSPNEHVFNFILSDGTRTNQTTGNFKLQDNYFDPSQVRKIVINNHANNITTGFKLFDKNNTELLKLGDNSHAE